MSIARLFRQQDFWAGLMFMAFGAIGIGGGLMYRVGTTQEMGPGYFPRAIGVALVLLGAIIFMRGILAPGKEVSRWAIRPLILLIVGILAFAYTLEWLGFVVAATALIFLSGVGGKEFDFKEVILLCAAVVTSAVLIFVKALSLPIPVWP